MMQMAMFVVVPPLLVERAGLPVAAHWQVYLPVVLASFVLMIPPLLAAERHGRSRRLFLGSIALLAAVQVGLTWWATGLVTIAVWLLGFFVAFNLLEAAIPSLVTRVAPPRAKGTALGVYNTTQAFGLFAGGALGGWLAKHYGAAACSWPPPPSRSCGRRSRRGCASRRRGRAAQSRKPGRLDDIDEAPIREWRSPMASVNKVILVGNLGRTPKRATCRTATRSPTSASRRPSAGRTSSRARTRKRPSGTGSSSARASPRSPAST